MDLMFYFIYVDLLVYGNFDELLEDPYMDVRYFCQKYKI